MSGHKFQVSRHTFHSFALAVVTIFENVATFYSSLLGVLLALCCDMAATCRDISLAAFFPIYVATKLIFVAQEFFSLCCDMDFTIATNFYWLA